ncbi:MAG: hypothetical protein JNN20_16585 [Betaproteobacteria bacterium]|nr:hypothetical protein [Betaproteobacteria bacterium]
MFYLFDTVQPNQNFWGRYRKPYALTSGNYLYVFPDGGALYTRWCDICLEEVLAQGKYRFAGGKISISWEPLVAEPNLPTELNAIHGAEWRTLTEHGAKRLELVGTKVLLMDPDNFQFAQRAKQNIDYFERVVEYHDWKGIPGRLVEQSKSGAPRHARQLKR